MQAPRPLIRFWHTVILDHWYSINSTKRKGCKLMGLGGNKKEGASKGTLATRPATYKPEQGWKQKGAGRRFHQPCQVRREPL